MTEKELTDKLGAMHLTFLDDEENRQGFEGKVCCSEGKAPSENELWRGFVLSAIGPRPMQLVVVIAVRNAVRAATITFAIISQKRLFFISYIDYSITINL